MKRKILISFVLIEMLIIMFGSFTVVKIKEQALITQHLYNYPFTVANATKTIQFKIVSMHRFMKDVVLAEDSADMEKAIKRVNINEKAVYKEFEIIFKRYQGDRNDIKKSFDMFVFWRSIREEIIFLKTIGETKKAVDITKGKGYQHVLKMDKNISFLADFAQKKAEVLTNEAEIKKTNTITLIIFTLLSLFMATLFIMIFLLKFLKKAEEKDQQLTQHSKMAQMGEMISMIAHQWRQPLSAISATTGRVRIKTELRSFNLDKEEGRSSFNFFLGECLDNIDEYIQSLSSTIDDFRNFYKPNKTYVSLALDEMISNSLKMIQASMKNQNITLMQELNGKDKIEMYDKEMMHVILNLLKNSQDNFSEKGVKNPLIKVSTKDNIILICDNGGGILEEHLEKIFDPYFSTKNEKNGTGLGLYMSKIIIEEHHGGTIKVENLDEGACFSIKIGKIKKR